MRLNHFFLLLLPNAGRQAPLEAVACTPLILIEAPSSTYPRGMLVVGKIPKKRRRPHAILHQATPIVLRHRSARPHHVSLRPESRWRDSDAPEHAGWPRTVSQRRRALPERSGRLRRMYRHLVLAGRPLRP